MNKIILSLSTLATVLLMAACGGASDNTSAIDNTAPVSSENRVIYQMNIGAYTPEGTFQAAQARLDELHTLGVDILWLMPIYPRGETMHSPYASMNFKEVNPAYGKVADLKSFVARAHELGMKVWLDWVPNHVAVENPWVKEHPNYFSKDAKGDMIHPHGWGDVFELNYKDDGLVKEMNDALRFWIEQADVDGFRCDYVSSPTIPVSYWQNIIAELKSSYGDKHIEFLSETDISNPFNNRIDVCGFDYDYAWDFQENLVKRFDANADNADTLKAICQQFLAASEKIKNRRMVYLTNHDQNYNDGGHTLKDFFGDNRYPLTVMQFTLYGMPLLYQGQEIGDPDTLNYFTDAKVKWDQVDEKMRNTVRTLVALHHTQSSLASAAPMEWLTSSDSHVLGYSRGNVVVLNLGSEPVEVKVTGVASGDYTQWLDSKTVAKETNLADVSLDADPTLSLDAKGYAVYVKK